MSGKKCSRIQELRNRSQASGANSLGLAKELDLYSSLLISINQDHEASEIENKAKTMRDKGGEAKSKCETRLGGLIAQR